MNTRIIIAIALMASSAAGSWFVTNAIWRAKHAELKMAYAQESELSINRARWVERERQEKVDALAAKLAAETEAANTTATTITKEVIKYETVYRNRCKLNNRWVQLHDAAATGRVPEAAEAASGADEADAEVGDAEALAMVTRNYAKCQTALTRLDGWKAYYDSSAAQVAE